MINYDAKLDELIRNAKIDSFGHLPIYAHYFLDPEKGTCHSTDILEYYGNGIPYEKWRKKVINAMIEDEKDRVFAEEQKNKWMVLRQ